MALFLKKTGSLMGTRVNEIAISGCADAGAADLVRKRGDCNRSVCGRHNIDDEVAFVLAGASNTNVAIVTLV